MYLVPANAGQIRNRQSTDSSRIFVPFIVINIVPVNIFQDTFVAWDARAYFGHWAWLLFPYSIGANVFRVNCYL